MIDYETIVNREEYLLREEFEKLDEDVKKEYEDKSNIVQEQIISAISQIKLIEKEAIGKLIENGEELSSEDEKNENTEKTSSQDKETGNIRKIFKRKYGNRI